jgi:type III pantothenate kinase
VCIAQSQVDGFGVRNAYRQPEKLGVDRWLALVAARQDLQPVCVVDCGTAITLDLLDGEGQHLGGLICPGLTLMKQALSDGTQALAFDGREFALKPADFTEAAIDSGTLFAAIGLVEAVLARQPEGFKIILTGGDALRIAGGLKLRHQVDDALVLRGLALILKGLR